MPPGPTSNTCGASMGRRDDADRSKSCSSSRSQGPGCKRPSRTPWECRSVPAQVRRLQLKDRSNQAVRSGRHYSYVVGSSNAAFGGAFLADFGSEGDNPGPMLFYVPTGTSDPLVTGDAAFLADLDTFISSESCLNGSRGSIAQRNDCETDWVNIVSVTV